jgi:hypothetical protein
MLHETQCNVSETVVNQANILQRIAIRKRLDPVSEKPAKLLLSRAFLMAAEVRYRQYPHSQIIPFQLRSFSSKLGVQVTSA